MDVLQPRTNTFFGREDPAFATARRRLADCGRTHPRLLSFGCSIGDEIASMRRVFGPDAEIVGCDVDEAVLRAAECSVGHLAAIVRSDEQVLTELGPFDFISAFAVLCINPPPKDFAHRFPVDRFDRMLQFLDSLLAPGGVLAVKNASYRFHDSPVAAGYDVLRSDAVWWNTHIPVFDRSGEPFLSVRFSPSTSYLVKGPAFRVEHDEEIADVLFQKRTNAPRRVIELRIAPAPQDFVAEAGYARANTDGDPAAPEAAIRVTQTITWGRSKTMGGEVLVKQITWPSLVGPGLHRRPATLESVGSGASVWGGPGLA